MIHPTAIIEDGAQLGAGCEINAYAIIKRGTVLGARVIVHSFAVVGGDPQDLKFTHETQSGVRIGADTTIRENVTINRSTSPGGFTEVGKNCLLMAACHVAHDCVIGSQVVMANNAMIAGHVTIGDHAFFGGGVGIHQFCRIGDSVMISGHASITRDVPPYVMAAERDDVIGLNLLGLKRRDFSRAAIIELKDAFRVVYFTPGNIRDVAAAALVGGEFSTAEARHFLEFFTGGKRGFVRARRDAEPKQEVEIV
ncbi:MAG TPA: acyl-ACP--UDP-N-acetylglucosamine O-acyltransferase [Opitutaceae bacterium]|jgi:UDP-N-acetylglucosamine acyltransferase|nr:acyl-ACP--UDP-N-acetylglucosamine O-acyltransferase [Opitutaceae bacterium]